MDSIEEVRQLLSEKISETQDEIDAAAAAGEESELPFLEGLMEAYEFVQAAIDYQREGA